MNPVKLPRVCGVEGRCVARSASRQGPLPGRSGRGAPTPPAGAPSALPGFRRAVLSDTALGPRLEARSKSWSKKPRIKSISRRAPAKFHQVPDAPGKGVSWGTWGSRPPRIPAGVRRWRAEGAGPATTEESEKAGLLPGGRRAGVKSSRSCRAFPRRGGRGRRRKPTGRDRLAVGGREARPARGWNYNRVEVRGQAPRQFTLRPPLGPTARPSPFNDPRLRPSLPVT